MEEGEQAENIYGVSSAAFKMQDLIDLSTGEAVSSSAETAFQSGTELSLRHPWCLFDQVGCIRAIHDGIWLQHSASMCGSPQWVWELGARMTCFVLCGDSCRFISCLAVKMDMATVAVPQRVSVCCEEGSEEGERRGHVRGGTVIISSPMVYALAETAIADKTCCPMLRLMGSVHPWGQGAPAT